MPFRVTDLGGKRGGGACFSYGTNPINLVDFKRFVELIAANSQSSEVKNACALVLANFDKTVLAVQTTNALDHQINGLGIVFPNYPWETPDYYWGYSFMADGWENFLYADWAAAGSV